MVSIRPVFLWADPRALRTPWPYLGGLAALLVFTPHLIWNAENDCLTMRFQFGHGFSAETGPLLGSLLPDSSVTQWPGMTRVSDYLRGEVADVPTLESIRTVGGFWLVSQAGCRPSFSGFRLSDATRLVDCAGEPLTSAPSHICPRPLHLWVIYRFETITDG